MDINNLLKQMKDADTRTENLKNTKKSPEQLKRAYINQLIGGYKRK